MSVAAGQLETFSPFQATVTEVLPDGTIMASRAGVLKTFPIPPVYYGGVKDCGVFMHPDIGDTLLCIRVHGGSKGVTQAIAVLAAEGKETRFAESDDSRAIGTSPYPMVEPGEVKILSSGGSELYLKGPGDLNEVHLTTSERSGVFISSDVTSFVTTISNVSQNITSGSRLISGDVIRNPGVSGQVDVSVGHEIEAYPKISGNLSGLYDGAAARSSSILGAPRNPILSEYRLVVNEFSEQAAFTGFDEEHACATSSDRKEYEKKAHWRALDPRTSLSLAPHQLVEIIAGNVVNSRAEPLDINYGSIKVGDSNGRQIINEMAYEADRLLSRRGIGYHFQLSTNSKSAETSGVINNYVCAIDKSGLLKISVPKGIGPGNVLFPTAALFGHESGGVYTVPVAKSAAERIPVTLRDEAGKAVHPKEDILKLHGVETRNTGIRFTNNSGYFPEDMGLAAGVGDVRVNFTAHHNMYAAAEMLIANTIQKILIPEDATECPGIIFAALGLQPFEKTLGNLDEKGELKHNAVKGMSTVAILPGAPALYPGGGTVVAGKHSLDFSEGKNKPYTNSFAVTGTAGEFSFTHTDKGVEKLKNPGGKSANINFQGAIDVSVGKDEHDEKSLVLDTAGSVVAWFGSDKNDRSLVVQTDGAVAVNVGAAGAGRPNGRFDLRVNVTDKGNIGEEWNPTKAGNDHASDFIISISDAGLVIAGMKPSAPMVIRNEGPISIESTAKLILGAASVEIREANKMPRPTHKAPTAQDQPPPDAAEVADKITCITDVLAKMTAEE
jgi:hypothetical protein